MLNLPSSPLWVTWCTRMFGISRLTRHSIREHVLGRERIGFEELEERVLGGVDRSTAREALQGDPGLHNLEWGAGREGLEEIGDSLEAREHVEEAVRALEDGAVRREAPCSARSAACSPWKAAWPAWSGLTMLPKFFRMLEADDAAIPSA